MADRAPSLDELTERLRRIVGVEIGKLETVPSLGDGAARARQARELADAIRLLTLAGGGGQRQTSRKPPHLWFLNEPEPAAGKGER